MAGLLRTLSFAQQLQDARVEAELAVTSALQPHAPAVAASLHAALSQLSGAPGSLAPLPAFQAALLPAFEPALASSVVEAVLLRPLWQD